MSNPLTDTMHFIAPPLVTRLPGIIPAASVSDILNSLSTEMAVF